MSLFDRLGDVIKSYLNDEDERIFGKSRSSNSRNDPDLDAAYEELDEYLNREKTRSSSWGDETPGKKKTDQSWNGGYGSYTDYLHEESAKRRAQKAADQKQEKPKTPRVPEALRKDFAELGIDFGSGLAECKASYKKLLKKHHPDRHAGHEGNMKKATERSSRINVSYRRIEVWYETGKVE